MYEDLNDLASEVAGQACEKPAEPKPPSKINWKQKLTSRKFWLAIIGFVTALLVTFGVSDLTIEHITGLIAAMGALIAFIVSEAYVDGKRAEGSGDGDENV